MFEFTLLAFDLSIKLVAFLGTSTLEVKFLSTLEVP